MLVISYITTIGVRVIDAICRLAIKHKLTFDALRFLRCLHSGVLLLGLDRYQQGLNRPKKNGVE